MIFNYETLDMHIEREAQKPRTEPLGITAFRENKGEDSAKMPEGRANKSNKPMNERTTKMK